MVSDPALPRRGARTTEQPHVDGVRTRGVHKTGVRRNGEPVEIVMARSKPVSAASPPAAAPPPAKTPSKGLGAMAKLKAAALKSVPETDDKAKDAPMSAAAAIGALTERVSIPGCPRGLECITERH